MLIEDEMNDDFLSQHTSYPKQKYLDQNSFQYQNQTQNQRYPHFL